MTILPRITRATLSGQVAEAIVDFIAEANLSPGESLPSEVRLAEQMGVSRPIIREALKSLAALDIIEIVNGRGAIVKPLDGQLLHHFFRRAVIMRPKSLVELMEVRKALEVQSATLAAARRTPEELVTMRQTVGAMAGVVHIPQAFADLDVAFHLQIAAASRNDMLYYLIQSIRESLKETILEGLRRSVKEEQFQAAVQIHHVLLEQLEKGDVAGATHYMIVHFDQAIATFLTPPDHAETGGNSAVEDGDPHDK